MILTPNEKKNIEKLTDEELNNICKNCGILGCLDCGIKLEKIKRRKNGCDENTIKKM